MLHPRGLSPLHAPTIPFAAAAGSFCSERALRVYRDRRTRFVGLIQFTRWPVSRSFVFFSRSPLRTFLVRTYAMMHPLPPPFYRPPPSFPLPLPSARSIRDLTCERLDRRRAASRGENSWGFANVRTPSSGRSFDSRSNAGEPRWRETSADGRSDEHERLLRSED